MSLITNLTYNLTAIIFFNFIVLKIDTQTNFKLGKMLFLKQVFIPFNLSTIKLKSQISTLLEESYVSTLKLLSMLCEYVINSY